MVRVARPCWWPGALERTFAFETYELSSAWPSLRKKNKTSTA
jgi:hypothetical protein